MLDDSEDEFYPSPTSRQKKVGKNKRKIMNKNRDTLNDEVTEEPKLFPNGRRSRSTSTTKSDSSKKGTINEEKVKKILSKVLDKSSASNSAPGLARSSSLSGKENDGVWRLRRGASLNSKPPPPGSRGQNLSSKWMKAKTALAPSSSVKKMFLTLDDDDDDDFVEEKKSKSKSKRQKTQSFDCEANSESDTLDTDTTIELDEEVEKELMEIDQLKRMFDVQAKPKTSKSSSKVKRNLSSSGNFSKAEKKAKLQPPVIICRGPVDCFDDLITETTRGYPCKFCDKETKFQRRREMINHLQTTHGETLSSEQRNRELAGLFECEDCGTLVRSKYVLRTHLKAHAKFKQDDESCDIYYKYYLEIGKTNF